MVGVAGKIMMTLVDVGHVFSVVGFWSVVLCPLGNFVISDKYDMLMSMSCDYGSFDDVVAMWL